MKTTKTIILALSSMLFMLNAKSQTFCDSVNYYYLASTEYHYEDSIVLQTHVRDMLNPSYSGADSIHINYGDGTSSKSFFPDSSGGKHAYINEGTYDVCLEVYKNGQMCSLCTLVEIYYPILTCDSVGINHPFVVNQSNGTISTPELFSKGYVNLDSIAIIADDQERVSIIKQNNGSFNMSSNTFTYSVNGIYNACWRLYYSNGDSCDYCETITLNQIANCYASFGFDQSVNSVIHLTDFSGGIGVSYLWDFGDGNTSTEENPVHTYAMNGEYEVCVTVSDTNSCSSTFCMDSIFVDVSNGPVYLVVDDPNFTVGQFELDQTLEVSIYPNPSSGVVNISSENQITSYVLYNSIGKVSAKGNNLSSNFNILIEEKGAYYIQLFSGNKYLTKRIIVN